MRINWLLCILPLIVAMATTFNHPLLWAAVALSTIWYFSYLNVISGEKHQDNVDATSTKAPLERMKALEKSLKQLYDHQRATDKKLKDAYEKLTGLDSRIHQRSKVERGMAKRGDWHRAIAEPKARAAIERAISSKPTPEEKN